MNKKGLSRRESVDLIEKHLESYLSRTRTSYGKKQVAKINLVVWKMQGYLKEPYYA